VTPFTTVSSGGTIESSWANAILAEAFEGSASFIIRQNGSYYEAIKKYGPSGAGTITYGGSTDEGGIDGTDASAVIQAVKDVLGTTGADADIYFKGDFIVDTALDLTDTDGLRCVGLGNKDSATKLTFNLETVGLDLVGANRLSFHNLWFQVGSGYTPNALVLLARQTDSTTAGRHIFTNCGFIGECDSALIYNYGSEINTWRDCYFNAVNKVMTISKNNVDSLTSAYATIDTGAQSTSVNKIVDSMIVRTGGSGPAFLLLDCVHTVFDNTFFGGTNLPAIQGGDATYGGPLGLYIRECRCETYPLLTTVANKTWADLKIRDVGWTTAAGTMIDLNKAGCLVEGAIIEGLQPTYNVDFPLEFHDLRDSRIDLTQGFKNVGSDLSLVVGGDFTDSKVVAYANGDVSVTGTITDVSIDIYGGGGTKNSGSDTIANGTTSKVVAHGLLVTPSAEHFSIIGKENPTNDVGTIWVDTIGATNFTVNVENDPGASNWDFGWKVNVI